MVPFKDALLGIEQRDYQRAVSCQRCLRAGGKHNDLENVGFTARHHTFFEMLGNFSFGDYFKEDAITWAWEFVEQHLELPKERIWITVHPTDYESREFWERKVGFPAERVVDIEDNFWAMGDTGPCGPCSELFFDQGSAVEGGPPGSKEEDGDRFLEFWNLVFPQFDRQSDGELEKLPSPGVDTGSGLERVAAIKQGVHSNYEIDAFQPTFQQLAQIQSNQSLVDIQQEPSYRVIADHLRAAAFLITDGVLPDREGRGYVLRRIVRRAIRHGYKQNLPIGFFAPLAEPLIEGMREAYPELKESATQISRALSKEEERFSETLEHGMSLLAKAISDSSTKVLDGSTAFKLYDTYGFPLDLTEDVCQEMGFSVDHSGFDQCMAEQRNRSRTSTQFASGLSQQSVTGSATSFVGYDTVKGESEVVGLYAEVDGSLNSVQELRPREKGVVVLEESGFYGESGGQVGDHGAIHVDGGSFEVRDTQVQNGVILHHGQLESGQLTIGASVSFNVDATRRQDIARNHSATHLLHAALKEILGSHVQQRGSLVAPGYLRFDFSHESVVTPQEVEQIEIRVNDLIAKNEPVQTSEMSYDAAIESGAVALFGEKYGDQVRVLTMGGSYSTELCGGTHVFSLGEIGSFKITGNSGIAAGTRRIEAITGRASHQKSVDDARILLDLQAQLNTSREELLNRVQELLEDKSNLSKQLTAFEEQSARRFSDDLLNQTEDVSGVPVLATVIEGDQRKMMQVHEQLRAQMQRGVIVLATVDQGKVQLVCSIDKPQASMVKAGNLIKHIAPLVGARGGGKPDFARAGGGDQPQNVNLALECVSAWVAEQIAAA